jgi:protein-S-isoprenylcysteine O-methyltransferase Ste14
MEFYAISHFQSTSTVADPLLLILVTLTICSFVGLFACFVRALHSDNSVSSKSSTTATSINTIFFLLLVITSICMSFSVFRKTEINAEQSKITTQAYSQYLQTVDQKTLVLVEKMMALEDPSSYKHIKHELLRREVKEYGDDLTIKIIK